VYLTQTNVVFATQVEGLADLVHQRGLFEAFLKVATIKKDPVLKREELYQGLIEPGWGAGLLNPAQGGERNIFYVTPLTLKSFLSERNASFCFALTVSPMRGARTATGRCLGNSSRSQHTFL